MIRSMITGLICLLAAACAAAAPETVMGEYKGIFTQSKNQNMPAEGTVVAEANGYYRLAFTAADPKGVAEPTQVELSGVQQGETVAIFGRAGGRMWTGTIKDGRIEATNNYYGMAFSLERYERTVPNVGTPPPADAIVLLPFKEGTPPDLSQWNNESWKPMPDGSMLSGSGDIQSKREFGDVQLHVEFRLPLMPDESGQHRGNSGVFLSKVYEIQVLDSFGLYESSGDCGSIYSQYRPLVNASLPPLQWQAYDITFRAARLNADGSPKEKPRITVIWNGVKIHDNVEFATPTGDPKLPHLAQGPIALQDHGNPVQYRNIWVVETK